MVCASCRGGNLLLIPALVEICDFGYPQNSEIDTLKSYITTESIVSTSAIAAVRCHLPVHLNIWCINYDWLRRNRQRSRCRPLVLRVGGGGM